MIRPKRCNECKGYIRKKVKPIYRISAIVGVQFFCSRWCHDKRIAREYERNNEVPYGVSIDCGDI